MPLTGVRPFDVAVYIEELQHEVTAPSVKRQLAAIRGQLSPDANDSIASIVGTDPVGATVMIRDVTNAAAPSVVTTTQDQGDGVWSVALNGLMSSGKHTLVAEAVDSDAHQSIASSPFTVTVGTDGSLQPDSNTISLQNAIQTAMADISNVTGAGNINIQKNLPGSMLGSMLAIKN